MRKDARKGLDRRGGIGYHSRSEATLAQRDTHTGDSNMAGFPENDIDDDEWDNDEDEREVARQKNRWSPEDDEVESLIDFADCNED